MQKRLWAMQLYVGVKRIYAGHDMHRIAGTRYITFFQRLSRLLIRAQCLESE